MHSELRRLMSYYLLHQSFQVQFNTQNEENRKRINIKNTRNETRQKVVETLPCSISETSNRHYSPLTDIINP